MDGDRGQSAGHGVPALAGCTAQLPSASKYFMIIKIASVAPAEAETPCPALRPVVTDRLFGKRHLFHFGCDSAQIIKREDAAGMAVGPGGLDAVSSHSGYGAQLKRLWRQWPIRVLVQVSHYIHLAFAAGTRTMTTKFFQRHEALALVLPSDS